eukprot:CAMPEP_0116124124 /NCGR_PEP_ID=MMETSP0329-20121206/5118_1 /TAXON_ID=697910 /ORGANISM="Pseudo-nitzschia arenysensis, Strain B593" /LENGTH=204 /DNA_ID=CAMNT_0003618093 /DNA_START=79 /DNA_END=693 /DNA_ORIENTATION=-
MTLISFDSEVESLISATARAIDPDKEALLMGQEFLIGKVVDFYDGDKRYKDVNEAKPSAPTYIGGEETTTGGKRVATGNKTFAPIPIVNAILLDHATESREYGTFLRVRYVQATDAKICSENDGHVAPYAVARLVKTNDDDENEDLEAGRQDRMEFGTESRPSKGQRFWDIMDNDYFLYSIFVTVISMSIFILVVEMVIVIVIV